jgi:hypothetical protein
MNPETIRAAEVREGDVLVDHDGTRSKVLATSVRDGVCHWLTRAWGDMARMPNERVRVAR